MKRACPIVFAVPFLLSAAAGHALAQECEGDSATFEPRTRFERDADFSAAPVPQIREHLTSVIADLVARDVSDLTRAQRRARAERIDDLAAYVARGQFPVNDAYAEPTPIFIDRTGTACAVGYLMISSGANDLAERIATTDNTAYVPEIDVEGVAAWIERSGLTSEECAQIQPTYGPCGFGGLVPEIRFYCDSAAINSIGSAGAMVACGSNDVATNFLSLGCFRLPDQVPGIFLASLDGGMTPNPAGSQGNLCLGGTVGRIGTPFVSSYLNWSGTSGGYLGIDTTSSPMPGGRVGIQAGETWCFQVWYRDQNPAPTSNFTNAMAITFR